MMRHLSTGDSLQPTGTGGRDDTGHLRGSADHTPRRARARAEVRAKQLGVGAYGAPNNAVQ